MESKLRLLRNSPISIKFRRIRANFEQKRLRNSIGGIDELVLHYVDITSLKPPEKGERATFSLRNNFHISDKGVFSR